MGSVRLPWREGAEKDRIGPTLLGVGASNYRYGTSSLCNSQPRQGSALSLVVILSLGLGIGANTAIFSLLHQVVLSSLPVERPEELAMVTAPGEFKGGRSATNDSGGMDYIFSYPVFRGLEEHAQGVAGFAGFRDIGANLSFRNQTVSQSIELVSGGYFPTLGVKAVIGRPITAGDDRTGAGNPVAMLGLATGGISWAGRRTS